MGLWLLPFCLFLTISIYNLEEKRKKDSRLDPNSLWNRLRSWLKRYMLDISSVNEYFLITREGPYKMRHLSLLPPTGTMKDGKIHPCFWKSQTSVFNWCSMASLPLLCWGLDCNLSSVRMIENNIKILSLNVNGLNNPIKRRKVMSRLKKHKS